jgi:hypothetical protein
VRANALKVDGSLGSSAYAPGSREIGQRRKLNDRSAGVVFAPDLGGDLLPTLAIDRTFVLLLRSR